MPSRPTLLRQAPPILGLLDIGTSKTACVILAASGRGEAEVLGVGQQPSRGLKAGVVIELDAAEQSVRAAVSEAERAAGRELGQVLLAVACGRLKSTTFSADARIGGRAVAHADVERLMTAGRSYVERDGRMLLHMNCLGYRLDGAAGIAEPRGLAGRVLSADLHAVAADAAPLRNLVHAAERAYLSVTGLLPAPYTSGLAVTTAQERRAGVIALDLGAGTTALSVFAEGHLIANEVIPSGGNHITFDVARNLQVPLAQAERIKTIYGHVSAAAADAEPTLPLRLETTPEAGLDRASRDQLADVIRHRVSALMDQIAERLERLNMAETETAGVVITGGAGQLPGLREFAAEALHRPVRIGQPAAINGLPAAAATCALASVLGLAEVAFDWTIGVRRRERNFRAGGYLSSVGRWLQASF